MNKHPVCTEGGHDEWGELRHVVVEHVGLLKDGEEAVGVAGEKSVRVSSSPTNAMSINNVAGSSLSPDSSTTSRWSRSSRSIKNNCVKKLNKKHLFGIALLMIVDLIWVGSAGLTKYLFKNQDYDKPLFTVYFKTILFTIYLLPFLFWRPWQRLCCDVSCRKVIKISLPINRTRQSSSNGHIASNGRLDYGSCDQITETDILVQRASSISSTECVDSSSFNSPSQMDNEKLGPSKYSPLKLTDDNCYDTNSLDIPRKLMLPTDKYLTSSSSVPLSRRKPTHVRFCQTVEVKTMPQSQLPVRETVTDTNTIPQHVPIIPVRVVMLLALVFGILWFFANYFYARALEKESVAAVNTLSSLSGVFVLILAAIPLPRLADKDRFSLTKLLIILFSVSGAVMIGFSPSSDKQGGISVGALYSVAGSCLYATYLVLLSKFLPHPDSLEVPMFFGFVGLLGGILLVPLVVSWHFLGLETFELPPSNEIWTILLVNGFVGTVLSELLWLWGCLLTSSLVGTLSLTLVTPLSITYSIIVSDTQFSPLFFVGAAIIVVTFVLISILDHTNGFDPVWFVIKRFWKYTFRDHKSHEDYDVLCEDSKDLLERETSPDDFDVSPPP